jgi:MarR family
MERSGSVLDQFRTAEQRVAERLRELEPLVKEYRELEQVAQRLGLDRGERAPAADNERPASPARNRGGRRRSQTKARSARSTPKASGKNGTAKSSAAGTPPRAVRRSRGVGGKGRGGLDGGSRQQDVLRLVNQQPGITVREIASALGVDATGLYRPVHRLEQRGAISKRGAALQPTGR